MPRKDCRLQPKGCSSVVSTFQRGGKTSWSLVKSPYAIFHILYSEKSLSSGFDKSVAVKSFVTNKHTSIK